MRTLAFHLPQFHPVPENDAWWGKGFTEWRNVAKAKPLFPGHCQPHLPADLGFYDLRLPEAREAQAELARQHGIHGFCHYHYWFNGRRILERPVNEILSSGKPDLPFCLCWANENWTRIWDGGTSDVLLEQNYNFDDDLTHINSLISAFRDERYIRVNGKPIFLVYRTGIMPNPKRTAEIWREAVHASGLDDLYLVRVESHGDIVDPVDIGFDAAVEFAPFNGLHWRMFDRKIFNVLSFFKMFPKSLLENKFYDYGEVADSMIARARPTFKRFNCVTPGWDNSARRKSNATILLNSTPSLYENWLKTSLIRTNQEFKGDEKIVFINAWNEWAEGNHLEPDNWNGLSYLEATRRAIDLNVDEFYSPTGKFEHIDLDKPLNLIHIVQNKFRNSSLLRDLRYINFPW